MTKSINFAKKMTFCQAFFLPFYITPLIAILKLINNVINIAIAPINVFLTAYFIDTALSIFKDGADWNLVIPSLMAMVAIRLYS